MENNTKAFLSPYVPRLGVFHFWSIRTFQEATNSLSERILLDSRLQHPARATFAKNKLESFRGAMEMRFIRAKSAMEFIQGSTRNP
jgi:hypothetical protein